MRVFRQIVQQSIEELIDRRAGFDKMIVINHHDKKTVNLFVDFGNERANARIQRARVIHPLQQGDCASAEMGKLSLNRGDKIFQKYLWIAIALIQTVPTNLQVGIMREIYEQTRLAIAG